MGYSIIEKLINLGYEEDINHMEYPYDLNNREEFTRTQLLTERGLLPPFLLHALADRTNSMGKHAGIAASLHG